MQAAQRHAAAERDLLQDEIAGRETGTRHKFLVSGDYTETGSSGSGKDGRRNRADDDAFYLQLMNEGAFGGYVAGQVFDAKSDSEIDVIVSRIESASGSTFAEYAANILGTEAAQRLPGESEADYKRRLLKALTEEIIDPHTGRIKAQYADDPLAVILMEDSTYQQIMLDVVRINDSGSGHDAEALVAELKDAGYSETELGGAHVRREEHKTELRDGQDGHRKASLQSATLGADSTNFFGSEDSTAQASEAGRDEFNAKAPPPDQTLKTSEQIADLSAPGSKVR